MKLFFFILLLLLCKITSAQFVELETISVSIEGPNQDVVIKWVPVNDTSQIIGYNIYKEEDNSGTSNTSLIASVSKKDDPIYTFQFPAVKTRPVIFVLYSYNKDLVRLFMVNYSQTMYNKIEYNDCSSELTLTWTPYYGWGKKNRPQYNEGNVKNYQIINYDTKEVVQKVGPDITTCTIKNIKANTTYKYYILATNSLDTTVTSKSNIDTVYTETLQPPRYITSQSASYTSDNSKVVINYTIDPNSFIYNYTLTRSETIGGTFKEIEKYQNIQDQLIAFDSNPLPTTAYYRLEATNFCGLPVAYSDTSTAIVPTKKISASNIIISWDEYFKWKTGVDRYQIYRYTNDVDSSWLASPDPSTLSFADDISVLAGQLTSSRIYYKVFAYANNYITNPEYKADSKKIFVDLSSEVYIPNAFTPDDNGLNDIFQAYFAFPPDNYHMVIYDRYGFKVFETSDAGPDSGWNGLLANNKRAPEGAYVYLIYFTTGEGQRIEKKGNFSLIYP